MQPANETFGGLKGKIKLSVFAAGGDGGNSNSNSNSSSTRWPLKGFSRQDNYTVQWAAVSGVNLSPGTHG